MGKKKYISQQWNGNLKRSHTKTIPFPIGNLRSASLDNPQIQMNSPRMISNN